jgi:tetratricopeptide (TPR) repeat protein
MMKDSKNISIKIVAISAIILSFVMFLTFFLIHFISFNIQPSVRNLEKLIKKGNYPQAARLIKDMDASDEKFYLVNGKIWLYKALEKQKSQRWKLYGTNSRDWFSSDEVDSSLAFFQDALGGTTLQQAEAYLFLGIIYKEKGWLGQAEEAFLESLSRNENLIDARIALSSLHVQQNRFSDAENELRKAFEESAKNPDISKNMAFLFHYYIKKPDSAMVWFNRYLNHINDRDLDVNIAKKEFLDLIARYPEYAPSEPQTWRKQKNLYHSRTKKD